MLANGNIMAYLIYTENGEELYYASDEDRYPLGDIVNINALSYSDRRAQRK